MPTEPPPTEPALPQPPGQPPQAQGPLPAGQLPPHSWLQAGARQHPPTPGADRAPPGPPLTAPLPPPPSALSHPPPGSPRAPQRAGRGQRRLKAARAGRGQSPEPGGADGGGGGARMAAASGGWWPGAAAAPNSPAPQDGGKGRGRARRAGLWEGRGRGVARAARRDLARARETRAGGSGARGSAPPHWSGGASGERRLPAFPWRPGRCRYGGPEGTKEAALCECGGSPGTRHGAPPARSQGTEQLLVHGSPGAPAVCALHACHLQHPHGKAAAGVNAGIDTPKGTHGSCCNSSL